MSMDMEEPKMNIKISVRIKEPFCKHVLQSGYKYNTKLSCFIFNGVQISPKSITVYGHSPQSLHVSGIESMQQVDVTCCLLKYFYQVEILHLQIDNIFFSHKSKTSIQTVNLHEIYYFLRDNYREYCVNFNVEIFPALRITPRVKGEKPSFHLFESGSYQVMGAKSNQDLKHSCDFIELLKTIFFKS